MRKLDIELMFAEHIDNTYPAVRIGDLTYPSSGIFKNMDPACYKEELLNWYEQQVRDGLLSPITEPETKDIEEEII